MGKQQTPVTPDVPVASLIDPIKRQAAVDATPSINTSNRTAINPDEYAGYLKNVVPAQDINLMRARAQPWTEQLTHSLAQAAGEVVGGTIEGIGATAEVVRPSFWKKVANDQMDFDNGLVEIGRNLREGISDATPIYAEKPGESFQVGDTGWWFSNLPSMASALSMLIPAKGAVSGLSLLGKAAQAAGKLGKVGATVAKLEGAISSNLRFATKLGLGASVSRNAENFKEAFGVAQEAKPLVLDKLADPEKRKEIMAGDGVRELRQKLGKQDVSDEEIATYIASKAAGRSYLVNSANIAFDALQFAPILRNFKATTRNSLGTPLKVLEANGRKLTALDKLAYYANPAMTYGAGAVSEGVEEGINFVGTGEGNARRDQLSGNGKEDSLGNAISRVPGYLGDGHFWESSFWGAAGGVAFEGAGALMHKDTGPQSTENKIQEIAQRKQMLSVYSGELEKVNNNPALSPEDKKLTTDRLKSQLSFQLGINASKAGNVDLLLEQFDDPAFKQSLIEAGLTDEGDLDKAIKHTTDDIKSAEKLYQTHAGRVFTSGLSQAAQHYIAAQGATTQHQVNKNEQTLIDLDQQISEQRQTGGYQLSDEQLRYKGLSHAIAAATVNQTTAQRNKDTATSELYGQVLETLEKEKAAIAPEHHTSGILGDSFVDKIANREIIAAHNQLLTQKVKDLDTTAGRNAALAQAATIGNQQLQANLDQLKNEVAAETSAEVLRKKLLDPSVAGNPVREKIVSDRLDALRSQTQQAQSAPVHQASVNASRNSPGTPPVTAANNPGPPPITANDPGPAPVSAPDPGASWDYAAAMSGNPVPQNYNMPDPGVAPIAAPDPIAPAVTAPDPVAATQTAPDPVDNWVDDLDDDAIQNDPYFDFSDPVIPASAPVLTLTDQGVVAFNTSPQSAQNQPAPDPVVSVVDSVDETQPVAEPLPMGVRGVKVDLWNPALKDSFTRLATNPNERLSDEHAQIIQALQSLKPGDNLELRRVKDSRDGKDWTDFSIHVFSGGVKIGELASLSTLLKQQRNTKPVGDKSLDVLKGLLNDKQLAIMRMRMAWQQNPDALIEVPIEEVSGGSIINLPTYNNLDITLSERVNNPLSKSGGLWVGNDKDRLIKPNTTDTIVIPKDKQPTQTNKDGIYQAGQVYILLEGFGSVQVPVPLSTPYLSEMPVLANEVENQLFELAGELQRGEMFEGVEGKKTVRPAITALTDKLSQLVYLHDTGGIFVADSHIDIPFRDKNGNIQKAQLFVRYKDGRVREHMALKVGDKIYEASGNQFYPAMVRIVGGVRLNVDQRLLNSNEPFQIGEGNTYPSYNHFVATALKSNVGTMVSKDGKTTTHFSPLSQGGKPGMDIAMKLPVSMPAAPRTQATTPAQTPAPAAQPVMLTSSTISAITPPAVIDKLFIARKHGFYHTGDIEHLAGILDKAATSEGKLKAIINIIGKSAPDKTALTAILDGVEKSDIDWIADRLSASGNLLPLFEATQELLSLQLPAQTPTIAPSQTKVTRASIAPLNNSGTALMSKADGTIVPAQRENLDRAEAWFNKTFEGVPFERVRGLIQNGGELAYGLFVNASVQLSDLATSGTVYHEAFHVAMHLYKTQQERDDIYREAAERYGNLGSLALEEKLAEDFRKFMIDKQSITGRIGQFFAELLHLIKQFLGKPGHTRELFKSIHSGAFRMQPTQTMVEYAKGLSALASPVEGFTHVEEKEILNNLSALMYPVLTSLVSPEYANRVATIKQQLRDLGRDDSDDNVLADSLYAEIQGRMVAPGLEEYHDNYQRILDAFDDGALTTGLWTRLKTKFKRERGLDLSNISLAEASDDPNVQDTLNGEQWETIERSFDSDPLQTDQKKQLTGKIKNLLRSVPDLKGFDVAAFKTDPTSKAYFTPNKSSLLGVTPFADFDQLFIKLSNSLSNLGSEDEMMRRLERLVEVVPAIGDIYRRLYEDNSLKTAFFVDFSKQTPTLDSRKIHTAPEGNGVEVDLMLANQNKPDMLLGKSMEEEVLQGAANYSELVWHEARKQTVWVDKATDYAGYQKAGEGVAAVFRALGIKQSVLEGGDNLIARTVEQLLLNGRKAEVEEILRSAGRIENAITKGRPGDETGNIRRLAAKIAYYQRVQGRNTARTPDGKSIYPVTLPTALSQFFGAMKNTDAEEQLKFRTMLSDYLKDPRFRYSNFMRGIVQWSGSYQENKAELDRRVQAWLDNNPEYLLYKQQKAARRGPQIVAYYASDQYSVDKTLLARLNEQALREVNETFVPVQPTPILEADGYPKLNQDFIQNFNYSLDLGLEGEESTKTYSQMDEGDFDLANFLKFIKGSHREGSGISMFSQMVPADGGQLYSVAMPSYTGDAMTNAVYNLVIQEVQAMRAAKSYLFDIVDGKPVAKSGTTPQQYYHTDKNGNLLKGGKPAGNVFRFQAFTALNGIPELFDPNGFLWDNDTLSEEKINALIKPVIQAALVTEAAKIQTKLAPIQKDLRPLLAGNITDQEYQQRVANFAMTFAANQIIFNTEYALWFHGASSEFKSFVDSNKRAKDAPGTPISKVSAGDTFRAVTLKDVERPSAILDTLIAGTLSSLQATGSYEGQKVRADFSELITQKGFSPANALERRLAGIIEPYTKINSTDAQGYMSLNRYEKVLRGMSRWSPRYEQLFKQVRAGEVLQPGEQAEFLSPLKPLYSGKGFNTSTQIVQRNLIKYASVVLTPALTKGTELNKLREWMDANDVDEAIYESAHKVGATGIYSLHNEGDFDTIDHDRLAATGKDYIRTYDNKNWQIQLDVPEHHIDASNKLGTQLAKLVLANINPAHGYTVAGKSLTGQELIDQNFKTLDDYIQLETQNLLDELGATLDETGNLTLGSLDKLRDLLQNELERRDTPDVLREIAQLDANGKWVIPLSFSSSADKFQSILLSLFTARITNLKAPGLSAVVVSSAFLKGNGSSGVQYSKEVRERGDFKLRGVHLKDGVIQPAEILLPHYMKEMFNVSHIDEVDPKLLEMILYRIPTEKKSSIPPGKVVGFLPPEMGSIMVVPDELVVQTGMDFDVDKLFTMTRNGGELSAKQSLQNQLFEQYWGVLTNGAHYLEMVSPQGFDTLTSVTAEVRALTGAGEELNPAYYSSQAEFKKRNTVGVALKGLAADANTFGATAQVSRMEFSEEMAPTMMYTAEDSDLSVLKSRYKDDVIDSTDDYIIVRHRGLGWSPDGSYLNAEGENILDVASQSVAAAVDIVKNPTFDALNVNTLTYQAFHSLVLAGIPLRTAALFTAQPVIKDLVTADSAQKSILNTDANEGIAKLANKVRKSYLQQLAQLGIPINWKDVNDAQFKNGSVAKLVQPGLAKINPQYQFKEFSAKRLLYNLKSAGMEDITPARKAAYLMDQLHALERMIGYQKAGSDLGDAIRVFKTDKLGAGPSTDVTHELLWTIKNKVNSGSIVVKDGEGYTTAARAIYPSLFGSDKPSVYAPLESYLKNANQLSIKLMSGQFLHETPAGSQIIEGIREAKAYAEGNYRYDAKLVKKIRRFVGTFTLSKLPFFEDTIDNSVSKRVVGLISQERAADAWERFKGLSAAQKVYAVMAPGNGVLAKALAVATEGDKSVYQNIQGNSDHLLQRLQPQLSPEAISKNKGTHQIDYKAPADDTTLLNSHSEDLLQLWNLPDSNPWNKYLRETAADLIRYTYFAKGMGYSSSSLAGIIPVAILNSQQLGVGEFMAELMSDSRNADHIQQLAGSPAYDLFMRSNWYDSEVVRVNPKQKVLEGNKAPDYYLSRTFGANPAYKGQPGVPRRIITSEVLMRAVDVDADGKTIYALVEKLGIPGKYVSYESGEALPKATVNQSRLSGSLETAAVTEEKTNRLTGIFANHGIKVETVTDTNLGEGVNAQVAKESGQTIVRINPTKVFGDTVIHEFGHIYVDLLGVQNPLVARGIEQLRGTALYAQVAAAYPELSGDELDKEVLVTAIGKKGEAIWNEEKTQSKFKTWLNQFFRAVGDLLGIERNAARQLAEELLSGKLQRTLDGEVSEMPRFQKGDVSEFLEKALSDTHKQINKFSANEAYTDKLADLIDHMEGLSDELAINNFAAYIENTLSQQQIALDNLERDSPMRYQTDAERTKAFQNQAGFLYHANTVVQSFKSVAELSDENVTPEVQGAIHRIQAVLPLLSRVETKIKRLMDTRFREHLAPLSSNPDVAAGVADIFDTLSTRYHLAEDESLTQRTLDAMSDTNNTFLSLVLKDYNQQSELSRQDTNTRKEAWRTLVGEIKASGMALDDLYEKDSAGNKTGRLLSQYDQPGWDAAKRAMEKQALSANNPGRVRATWLAANTKGNPQVLAEGKAIEAAKGKTSPEYISWYDAHYKTGQHGNSYLKSQYRVPSDKWASNAYTAIASNPARFALFTRLQDTLSELVSHTNYSIIKNGYLPAVPLDQRSYWEAIKAALPQSRKKKGDQDGEEDTQDVIVDETGRVISFLPFHYQRKLNQLNRKKADPSATPDEKKQIALDNITIDEANEKAHAAALDFDLEKTLELFIDTAMNHKFKKTMEGTVLLAREQLARQNIQRAGGTLFRDKVSSALTGEDVPVVIEGKESNVFKHYEDWLRMVFYEDFEYGDNGDKWVEYARMAQNALSYTAIGFNVFSGVSNVVYGETQIAIEAAAGQFFDKGAWAKANADYHSDQIGLLYRGHEKTSKTKVEAAMKFFDVLQSQDELSGKAGGVATSKLHKLKMVTSLAYALQHVGEHQMQNKGLLAMMHHEKVTRDGKEMSLFDALDFTDGKLVLPDGIMYKGKSFGRRELSNFKVRVMGVNQHLHGIYSKEDAGTIQKYALGRLAMQFRKWARPGWTKRFGTKMGQSFWNERREMLDEGSYITTAKFALKLIKDLRTLQTNSSLHWANLDDTQKANVKRTLAEAMAMVGIMVTAELLANVLSGFGDDDDDHKLLAFIAYESSRLRSELLTYSPFGILDEGKKLIQSPVPMMSQFEKGIKLIKALTMYPFRDDEERTFQGGQFYGEDKASVYATQMVPLYNQLQRWQFLQKNTRYYSLF